MLRRKPKPKARIAEHPCTQEPSALEELGVSLPDLATSTPEDMALSRPVQIERALPNTLKSNYR